MVTGSDLKGLLCPFLLLIFIYLVWFMRYLVWRLFEFVEPLFLMLILSYFVILLFSIFFLKKDAKKSLSEVFKVHSYGLIPIAMVFAFIFQAVWFTISLNMDANLEFLSFPSLKGYESYAVYSTPLAFMLYAAFAVFGAFVEEVAFRGYVQSRIASKYDHTVGVFIASLLFSLQHVHVFNLEWIQKFFQTQFIYVLCFGIFVGYLFFKSEEDLWSVPCIPRAHEHLQCFSTNQSDIHIPICHASSNNCSFLFHDSTSPTCTYRGDNTYNEQHEVFLSEWREFHSGLT